MAYPVDTVVTEVGDVDTSITVALPEHQEGDVIFVCVAQDGTATLSGPGAPWVVVSAGNVGGAGRLVMYAVCGVSPLADPLVTSNISDGINAVAVTVRDVDTTTPIDAWQYGSATGSAGVSSPAVTTATNSCLMLAFFVCDQGLTVRWPLDQINILGMSFDGGVTNVAGFRVAGAAGVAPAITNGIMSAPDTWQFVYIAVRNKAEGSLPAELVSGPTLLANYGYTTPTLTGLSALTASIDGLTVYNAIGTSTFRPPGEWDNSLAIGGSAPANAPGWHGATHPISITDFTSGLLTMRFAWVNSNTMYGTRGWIVILSDASSNWAAYQILTRGQIKFEETATVVFDFPSITPLDGSATPPNLSAITRIGYAYHRLNTSLTSSRYITLCQLLYWKGATLKGGSAVSPASIYALAKTLRAARVFDVIPLQGGGQSLLRVPVGFGDWSAVSYIGADPGASTEFRRPVAQQKTTELSLDITINASASDVVSFDFSSLGSSKKQLFRIASTSSPSATYSFTGTVFSGLEVEWRSGIPCDGANFFGCHQIETDGAPFSNCSFSGSVATADLLTSNPANISNCAFTQGDAGGHAIEITQPGTYNFVGNTFEGYGLDGTTDAVIYNNSGGHVVLDVSGGGDTPTVRNGAGASTEVVSGAQVSVIGLAAGSQVKVTKVSDGAVLFNGAESGGDISFSTTYIGAVRIEARKASAAPFYKPWATQANTISGQTVEVTALQEFDE